MSLATCTAASLGEVWPRSLRVVDGVAELADCSVPDLAAEFGTPLFALDEADVRSRAREFARAFADGDVYYAGKAFLCTTLARWMQAEGLGIDVSSWGELSVALAAELPGDRLVLHGNNKSIAELRRAVAAGVGLVVVDSLIEIDRLAAIAAAAGRRQPVLVRTTVGLDAATHAYVSTAHDDQKFGFALTDGSAQAAVRAVVAAPSLDFAGLHSHIGSQIAEPDQFLQAAQRLVRFAAQIRRNYGATTRVLDLGGGLGIAYEPGQPVLSARTLAERLQATVTSAWLDAGLTGRPRIAVEPGRSVVGPSTITVYEVGTVKPVTAADGGIRTYVSVDGGMSDNIRTSLYGARYTCRLANRPSDVAPVRARVVGKHCETGDTVVRDAALPGDVQPGDLLMVAGSGAYHRSLANNYNLVPRPPVIAVRDGRAQVVLRRESDGDLLRLDPGAEPG